MQWKYIHGMNVRQETARENQWGNRMRRVRVKRSEKR